MRRSRCNRVPLLPLYVAAGAVLATASEAGAQQHVIQESAAERSDECCLMLLLPVGARMVSLGGATAARASSDAMFGNPAGLAPLDSGQFVLHHADDVIGQSMTLSLLLAPDGIGTIALSYRLLDHGESEHTDPDNMRTGVLSISEQVLMGSFATSFGPVSAGLNYKVYQFRIDCRGSCSDVEEIAATTHGLDLGAAYSPSWLPFLRVGAGVQNLGLPLQVVNHAQSDPLPTRMRAGVALDVLAPLLEDSVFALWLSADVEDQWGRGRDPRYGLGAELSVAEAVFVRGGYLEGEGLTGGASLGLGFQLNRFALGLARTFRTSGLMPEGEPLQVSFGVRF